MSALVTHFIAQEACLTKKKHIKTDPFTSTIPLLIQLINQPIFLVHMPSATTIGRCVQVAIPAAAERGSFAVE